MPVMPRNLHAKFGLNMSKEKGVIREVSFFTGRAPENWGESGTFLNQKGDQKIFQIKKGDHLYFLKK